MRRSKVCPCCGVDKPVEGFHASNKRAGAPIGDGTFIQSRCKACQLNDKALARARNKAFLNEVKAASGCVDCGYNEHAFALDFHHVRGEKKFSVSDRRGVQASLKALQDEIKKCVVVCAICHRKRHHLEGAHVAD